MNTLCCATGKNNSVSTRPTLIDSSVVRKAGSVSYVGGSASEFISVLQYVAVWVAFQNGTSCITETPINRLSQFIYKP
jgi:hypothetical protein